MGRKLLFTSTIFLLLFDSTYSQEDNRNEYRFGPELAKFLAVQLECLTCYINYGEYELSFESKQLLRSHLYFTMLYTKGNGYISDLIYSNLRDYEIKNHMFTPGLGYMLKKGFSVNVSGFWGNFSEKGQYVFVGDFFEGKKIDISNKVNYFGFNLESKYYTPLVAKKLRFCAAFLLRRAFSNNYNGNMDVDDYVPGSFKNPNNWSVGFRVYLYITFFPKTN